MSVDAIRAGGDFRVGDVLARAWNVFTGNILFFLGITFFVYLAIGIAVGLFIVPFALAGALGDAWGVLAVGAFLAVILFLALNTIGEAVLLLGAFQRMRGEPLRVSAALQQAFARFLPLIGLGILWALALLFGFLLLIVPGVILLCTWWVVVPVCVVEGLGPIASFSRSSALTKGYRWKIFGLLAVLFVMNGIGSKIVELIFGLAGETMAGLGSLLWFAAWTAFWNCVLIMTYHDLRVAKEGIDTEQIAAIFD
jgi:hypothetical protein